jgi:hypothetical protein
MLLDEEGCVWSFGHPENGTLGHNDDGKFMQKANKVEFRYEWTPFSGLWIRILMDPLSFELLYPDPAGQKWPTKIEKVKNFHVLKC